MREIKFTLILFTTLLLSGFQANAGLFENGTIYRCPNKPMSRAMEIHLNRDNQQAIILVIGVNIQGQLQDFNLNEKCKADSSYELIGQDLRINTETGNNPQDKQCNEMLNFTLSGGEGFWGSRKIQCEVK